MKTILAVAATLISANVMAASVLPALPVSSVELRSTNEHAIYLTGAPATSEGCVLDDRYITSNPLFVITAENAWVAALDGLPVCLALRLDNCQTINGPGSATAPEITKMQLAECAP